MLEKKNHNIFLYFRNTCRMSKNFNFMHGNFYSKCTKLVHVLRSHCYTCYAILYMLIMKKFVCFKIKKCNSIRLDLKFCFFLRVRNLSKLKTIIKSSMFLFNL